MSARGDAGGAAMSGGQNYQAEVTSWWMLRMLFQTPLGREYQLPDNILVENVGCETGDEVDDVRIKLSIDSVVYIQCKRSIIFSTTVNSEWRKTLKQFIREEREENPDEISKVYELSYEKNNEIFVILKAMLNRIRENSDLNYYDYQPINDKEREIYHKLTNLLEEIYEINDGNRSEIRTQVNHIVRKIYIRQIKFSIGDELYTQTLDNIKTLLVNVEQTNNVIGKLNEISDDLMTNRKSINRYDLRKRLFNQGYLLQGSIDLRNDYKKLSELTNEEIDIEKGSGKNRLIIQGQNVTIRRSVVDQVLEAAEESSLLVTGEAGSGKSGCLLSVYELLKERNYTVWYWRAEKFPNSNCLGIKNEIGIENQVSEIFNDASTGNKTFLIIDGLDALRDPVTRKGIIDLIKIALKYEVKVIASIRKFDLQLSPDLERMIGLSSNQQMINIEIGDLDDNELQQVLTNFETINSLIRQSPQLKSLIRNLFNLRLLCEIAEEDGFETQFSNFTQIELFERYWESKIRNQSHRHNINVFLSKIIEDMVDKESLRVRLPQIPIEPEVIICLKSLGILRIPPAEKGRLVRNEQVEFRHHLLFDFIAEKLFIEPKFDCFVSELNNIDNWSFFLRPSLILFFRKLWKTARTDFWETVFKLEENNTPFLSRITYYLVIVEEAVSIENDLEFLLTKVDSSCPEDRKIWIGIIDNIIKVGCADVFMNQFDSGTGELWLELSKKLIESDDKLLVHSARLILFSASDFIDHLSLDCRKLLNISSRKLIQHYMKQDDWPTNSSKYIVRFICKTYEVEEVDTVPFIRKLITPEEMKRSAYIIAYDIVNCIEHIWQYHKELVIDIYTAIFNYKERDTSQPTLLNDSRILPLTGNRGQDYDTVVDVLTESYSNLLENDPLAATELLIRAFENYKLSQYSQHVKFHLNGYECEILINWGLGYIRENKSDRMKMLLVWKKFISNQDNFIDNRLMVEEIVNKLCLLNKNGLIWKVFIEAMIAIPDLYIDIAWSMMNNPEIMFNMPIQGIIRELFRACIPYLSKEQIDGLQTKIIEISSSDQINELEKKHARALLEMIPVDFQHEQTKSILESRIPELDGEKKNNKTYPSFTWTDESTIDDFIGEQEKIEDNILNTRLSLIETRIKLFELQAEVNKNGKITDDVNQLYSQISNSFLSCFNEETVEEQMEYIRNKSIGSLYSGVNRIRKIIKFISRNNQLSISEKELLALFASSPNYTIRLLTAERISQLIKKDLEFSLGILRQWINEISFRPSNVVFLYMIFINYLVLYELDREKSKELLIMLIDNTKNMKYKKISKISGAMLSDMVIIYNEAWASEIIMQILCNVKENIYLISGVSSHITHYLFPANSERTPVIDEEKIKIGSEILISIFKSIGSEHLRYIEHIKQNQKSDNEWLKEAVDFIGFTTVRFRFAAEKINRMKIDLVEKENFIDRFIKMSEPIIYSLEYILYPRIAHDIITGLKYVADLNLKKTLELLFFVVKNSEKMGLTLEKLAVDVIVEILSGILIEGEAILKTSTEDRKNFLAILELCVKIGWPNAMKLAVSYSSIYR